MRIECGNLQTKMERITQMSYILFIHIAYIKCKTSPLHPLKLESMKLAVYIINTEQDRQCTNNVILRRVHIISIVLKNEVLHILRVCLWTVWLYHIFPCYLINSTIF